MPAAVPRLLAFAGSLRQGSYNRRLVHVLADGARAAGAEVTLIELRDYSLPVYALGGMREADVMTAWQMGAHGISMMRGAWQP